MFISYTFEDSFFSGFFESANIDLSFERINNLLDDFEKNTRFIDCFNEGRKESLNNDWNTVYQSLLNTDVVLKKQFEILWHDRILKKAFFAPKIEECNCKSIDDCSLSMNLFQVQKVCKSFPHLILSHNPQKKLGNNLPFNNFKENDLYKKYFDRTSYEEELLLNEQSGIRMIKKNWADLIINCKNNITIYDRNIFDKWDTNYAGGLRQFVNVIMELNPKLHLNLITKKAPHKSSQSRTPKSLYDVRNEISNELKANSPCKIELVLCDADAKFDHDRFILFDNIIAAQLNRGLDTFYAASSSGEPKIDRYRIIYYKYEEVKSYIQDPLRNRTQDEDFKNLKNY